MVRTGATSTGSRLRAGTARAAAGLRGAAAGVKAGTARTAAGVKAGTARTVAGVKGRTQRTAAGVMSGTARTAAGMRGAAARTAASLRARAEARRTRAGTRAEAKRIQAEARAETKRIQAEARRVEAEARAERKRAEVEAKRVEAEARNEARRAEAEARAETKRAEADAKARVEAAPVGAVAATAAADAQPPAEPEPTTVEADDTVRPATRAGAADAGPGTPLGTRAEAAAEAGMRRVAEPQTEPTPETEPSTGTAPGTGYAAGVESAASAAEPSTRSVAELLAPVESQPDDGTPNEPTAPDTTAADDTATGTTAAGTTAVGTTAGDTDEAASDDATPERADPVDAETTDATTTGATMGDGAAGDGAAGDATPADDAADGGTAPPAAGGPTATTGPRSALARAAERSRSAAGAPARWRAEARERAVSKATARTTARERAAAQAEAARRAAMESAALRRAAQRRAAKRRTVLRLVAKERARRIRRRRILVAVAVALLMGSAGVAVGAYYVDRIPTPDQLALPESTTIFFSDGVTPMARLGTENRTILAYDEMNDAVKQAIVAAEDRSFWTHSGVDLSSVLRAAWNNVRGGRTQGASTITQQYARIAADLEGLTYARKAREALLAWKMDGRYSKEQILEFYLNTVPFGRGAYGIEAAAQAFFGKTVRTSAAPEDQITVGEAMLLASLVKQPEPDPADPEGSPGYDPARGGIAAANAVSRWEYIREGMVVLGFLDRADADALQFPHTVRGLTDGVSQDGLDRPTGLVVNHVLSELRANPPFKDQAPDYIRNGGFRIVTTIDKRAQDVAEATADIRRVTAPDAVRGQPANWQAALVAVEPGTGRVLAYYGGNRGTGADHAGWYHDEEGKTRGFGHHPPGSTFKVYDLAEALRQKVSLWSRWDSPASKEFPASGRTRGSRAGPVRNASSARCQPQCMLWEAAVASLNVPFYDLTERLGAANVIDMATRSGIDSMWTDGSRSTASTRVDLRGRSAREVVASSAAAAGGGGKFWTEVGIGQYGVTVLDHANGMATFAAGGKRAPAHFVREVLRHGVRVYAETITQTGVGLTTAQVDQLTWTLSQVAAARLDNGWEAAGKTGTWQAAASTTRNAHTWMVGYTTRLAVAVWVGTTDGKALVTRDGKYNVFGSTHPAPIWRQFLVEATKALAFDLKDRHFRTAKLGSPPPTRRR